MRQRVGSLVVGISFSGRGHGRDHILHIYFFTRYVSKLLAALPSTTVYLFGEVLRTEGGRVHALKGLAKLHTGEVVEVDATRSEWRLVPVPPGSASGGGAPGSPPGGFLGRAVVLPAARQGLAFASTRAA